MGGGARAARESRQHRRASRQIPISPFTLRIWRRGSGFSLLVTTRMNQGQCPCENRWKLILSVPRVRVCGCQSFVFMTMRILLKEPFALRGVRPVVWAYVNDFWEGVS